MPSSRTLVTDADEPDTRLYERGWSLHSSKCSNHEDLVRALVGRVSNVVEILWRRSPSIGIWT
jgi:hypothetical protein